MVPTLPEGLGPLFSLRPLRDFASNLPNSIPKPNLVTKEFDNSKEAVVTPQQAESNQAEIRSEDLGQSEPVPFALKPLNKLSERDVARIRDSVAPTLSQDNPIEQDRRVDDRLALRKEVVRPESVDQFSKPTGRNFLREEENAILSQDDVQARQVITTANALQATVIPPSARELQPEIKDSPNAQKVNDLAIETARLQPIEKREVPLPAPTEREPKTEVTPPPVENKQPQGSEPGVQSTLPNPNLQERVRSAYGLPSLNQTAVPKTQDLFDRLSTVSVRG
jgi:hypothetical protein